MSQHRMMRKLKNFQRRICTLCNSSICMKRGKKILQSRLTLLTFFWSKSFHRLHPSSPMLPHSLISIQSQLEWRDWKKLKNEIFAASEISFIKNFSFSLFRYLSKNWEKEICNITRARMGWESELIESTRFLVVLSSCLDEHTIRWRINNFPSWWFSSHPCCLCVPFISLASLISSIHDDEIFKSITVNPPQPGTSKTSTRKVNKNYDFVAWDEHTCDTKQISLTISLMRNYVKLIKNSTLLRW